MTLISSSKWPVDITPTKGEENPKPIYKHVNEKVTPIYANYRLREKLPSTRRRWLRRQYENSTYNKTQVKMKNCFEASRETISLSEWNVSNSGFFIKCSKLQSYLLISNYSNVSKLANIYIYLRVSSDKSTLLWLHSYVFLINVKLRALRSFSVLLPRN